MKNSTLRIPMKVKIGYGVAELGTSAVEVMMRLYLLIFYTDVVGLQPHLVGCAVAIAILWDAITDPILGTVSDRTKSKIGKRRPFILVGGVLLPIAILFIYNPPYLATQAGKFFFLLVSYIVVNTAMTVLSIPHAALGGELSSDRHERTELFGWRFLFANFGALLAAGSPATKYLAIAVFISAFITYFATKGRDFPATTNKPLTNSRPLKTLKSVTKNRIFVPLFLAYLVATIGLSLNSAIAIFYYKYRLRLTETEIQYIIGLFIFVISISIAGWVIVSKKYGKKWPAFYGILALGIMTVICYPLFPVRNFYPPLFAAVFGGIMAGATVILDSLVADAVDYDRLQTGEHREGLYFGIWRMGAKMSRAISIVLCGVWLKLIDFVPNSIQTPAVSEKLAWMFGPGVGIFLLIAGIIFAFVPYKDEEHRRVQSQLSAC